MISRLIFSRAVRRVGRLRLMLASAVFGGAGLLLLALPLPLWAIALSMVVAGFGLGVALTSSIGMTLEIAPPAARGTALSLRLTANRISQFAVPLLAGFVVAPMGAAGIFGLTGLALLGAILVRPRGLPGQPGRSRSWRSCTPQWPWWRSVVRTGLMTSSLCAVTYCSGGSSNSV